MNAGLIGPQFTYARGKMVETKKRYREFPVLLHGSDESTSFYAAENARRAGKNVSVDYQSTFSELIQHGNQSVWRPQLTNLMSSTKYSDAPNFLSVNGLVFGNLPTFEMCLNDEVIWYVYGQLSFRPFYLTSTCRKIVKKQQQAKAMTPIPCISTETASTTTATGRLPSVSSQARWKPCT